MRTMENNILDRHYISYLGRPTRKMFFSFWVKVCGAIPSSIRRFFERLMLNMEFGFAAKYTMDLFTKGVISRDEMLARIDELERKFNKDKN